MNYSNKLKLLFALIMLLLSSSASAAFIIVNTVDDEFNNDGDCSLREAVRSANEDMSVDSCAAGLGADDIFIAQTGTIMLTQALVISEQVNIFGPGMDALTLNGGRVTPIFVVDLPDDNHDFELSLMTLEGGSSAAPGGAVRLLRGGTFSFENVLFFNNVTLGLQAYGGAIATDSLPLADNSRVEIRRCRFQSNSTDSKGGAVAIDHAASFQRLEALIIEESRFIDNSADGAGGAVAGGRSSLVSIDRSHFADNEGITGGAVKLEADTSGTALRIVTASTFSDNQATNTGASGGGAISAIQGATLIENSTFTNNFSASELGNAIEARSNENMAIFHSTFIENNVGRTDENVLHVSSNSDLGMGHSIVYSSDANSKPECLVADTGSSFSSLGYNIDASGTCTGHASDLPATDPQLAPFRFYGDDTSFLTLQTFLPLNGPALNGGQPGPCAAGLGGLLSEDQRGEPRPTSAGSNRCDIGAVEVQPGSDPTGFPFFVDIGSGSGWVASSPGGIDCPGDCIGQFLENSTVTLMAEPGPGYAFTSWSGACSGTNPTCQFTITGAGSATANFELTGFTLDAAVEGNANGVIVSVGPGGDAIDCPPSCSANYPEGVTIELLATAAPGAQFQNWAGNCSGSGSCIVTLDDNRRVIGIFTDSDTLFLDGFE